MAAQSGIAPTRALQDTWATALADPLTRLIKVSISDEQLVPAGSFPTSAASDSHSDSNDDGAIERDFALFDHDGVVQDREPAYYIYRLTPPPTSSFLFISYVPDAAPVRAKMLYASTRNTLVRALGDARMTTSVFATSRADLTHASYVSHAAHDAASAPLTAREQEMAAIRAAEADAAGDAPAGRGEGRSMVFGAEGDGEGEGDEGEPRGVLRWSEDAREAVRSLGDDAGGAEAVGKLEVDVATETVVLSSAQPASLSDLPTASPAYVFCRHAAGVVLIYSCPPTSPIKHRLLYSSAVLPLYRVAAPRFAGVTVLKKLETDDPAEVSPAWIDAELGPLAAAPAPAPAASEGDGADTGGAATPLQVQEEDRPRFARPARPGRRR
ncbi:hypothetical protein DMC30DRAFT_355943 [Rhodotorula diobovata]|uniref:ADF-H domain-containing protein n=1 Tax=Rhodotorula diobovata TaxID=5288 RepID=A0A5C5FN04_9BASI|nr:hypothetical protein DMC30DRAFT_355943 [Rhodotorula diobovata]